MALRKLHRFLECSTVLFAVSLSFVSTMDLNNVKFIESAPDSRLVATSNYNYGLTSPKLLTKDWKTVSVNGNSILTVTATGEKLLTSRDKMETSSMSLIESLRDDIANSDTGFSQISSSNGGSSTGGNLMMSSSSGTGSVISSSSTGSFSSVSSIGGQSSQVNDISVNMKDENNFSISKSGLPFNWRRVFFNKDLVTFVMKNGDVEMLPINSIEPAKLEAINKLKDEVKEMHKTQSKQAESTMQNSMDTVSNVFNNIMGNFPRPPSYESAVGNSFGSNFPFGPNNSPFSSSSRWPFSNGAFAGAFAGRR